MAYKRAAKMFSDAGIDFITLQKGLYGVSPYFKLAYRQESGVFADWRTAAAAVLDGYRPIMLWQVVIASDGDYHVFDADGESAGCLDMYTYQRICTHHALAGGSGDDTLRVSGRYEAYQSSRVAFLKSVETYSQVELSGQVVPVYAALEARWSTKKAEASN